MNENSKLFYPDLEPAERERLAEALGLSMCEGLVVLDECSAACLQKYNEQLVQCVKLVNPIRIAACSAMAALEFQRCLANCKTPS